MEGMNFLLVNEQGKPISHGIIAQRINENRYLCTFLRAPQVSRAVSVEEIGSWNLFANQDAMNAFIAKLPKATPAPGTGGERDPAEGNNELPPPPAGKKKPAKKASKKKPSK